VTRVPSLGPGDKIPQSRLPLHLTEDAIRGTIAAAVSQAFQPIVLRPPNAPATFTTTVQANGSVSASWAASTVPTGGPSVTGYRIFDGSTQIATVNASTATTLSGLTVGSHTLTVRAYNADGESGPSPQRVVTIAAVGTTPTLSARVVGVGGRLRTETTDAVSVRMKIGTDTAVATGVIYTTAATPDSDGWALNVPTGLTPGRVYYYRVGMTNSSGQETFDNGSVGKFRAPPTSATSFAWNAGSCCNASDSAAMSAIAARGDDLFIHLGDAWYDDGASRTVESYRTHMGDTLRVTNHAATYSTTTMAYIPSDHDFSMANNGNGASTATGRDSFNTVYRQLIPNAPVPATTGIYHTFTWGRVRFIMLDCRSLASAASATDNSSKSMLGSTQKTWLKNTITASTSALNVVCGDTTWITAGDPTDDAWAGFTTERGELATFFAGSGKNICYMGGDMHALAADSGTNAPGRIACFQSAPLNNSSSIKGGPYSAGTYPTSSGSTVQQYGRFVLTDTGGSTITLAYTGYSSSNTSRITLTKSYTV